MVKCLTVEKEVAGSIPATTRLILGVLKSLRNEGTSLALQIARPLCHSYDYTTMAVLSLLGDVKILSPISTFVLKK